MSRTSRRLPVEDPAAALTGYKLAQLLLSTDGRAVAFAGLSIGAHRVYDLVDEAECVFSPRHAPPHRWCDCGFYCVHTPDAARAMAADATYRGGVLLDVAVSGRFIRYERGFRYQRQRVRGMRIGLCGCGRRAECFVDAGAGLEGWRRLLPVCEVCAGFKPQVGVRRVAALLPEVPVGPDAGVRPLDDLPVPPGVRRAAADATVALLSAEVAVLHARLDALQSRLASLETPEPPRNPAPD